MNPELILDEAHIQEILQRAVRDFILRLPGVERLAFIGLPTRGFYLAQRLADLCTAQTGRRPPVGQIDITFHRDDIAQHLPVPQRTEIPFDTANREIVLVDDVLFTGRTVRAALCALMDFGRPSAIKLFTLVERGHRQLPIQADFTGLFLTTQLADVVAVKLREVDACPWDAVEWWRAG